MDEIKDFFRNYKGAIIGVIVAIVILVTRLSELIMGIIIIVLCAMAGHYIQKNKYDVKEKLKSFIDRM